MHKLQSDNLKFQNKNYKIVDNIENHRNLS